MTAWLTAPCHSRSRHRSTAAPHSHRRHTTITSARIRGHIFVGCREPFVRGRGVLDVVSVHARRLCQDVEQHPRYERSEVVLIAFVLEPHGAEGVLDRGIHGHQQQPYSTRLLEGPPVLHLCSYAYDLAMMEPTVPARNGESRMAMTSPLVMRVIACCPSGLMFKAATCTAAGAMTPPKAVPAV
jgi:hypothetical protein